MKTDGDADDELIPGDSTTGWNIVSHPSVFAGVFHWRHEQDHDCENTSTQEPMLSDWTIIKKKKKPAGCGRRFRKHQKNTGKEADWGLERSKENPAAPKLVVISIIGLCSSD